MERAAVRNAPAAPVLFGAPALPSWRSRLGPLWRHAVWALSVFAVLAASVAIRLDVQQTRKDLDRNSRAQREAGIENDRLRLELDARRRTVAMEQVAAQLQMSADAAVYRVGGGR